MTRTVNGKEINFAEVLAAMKASGYKCFGVRTGRTATVGEALEYSYDWDIENDVQSDEQLNGTCATGIGYLWLDDESDEDDMALIIEAINKNHDYPGQMQYIIGGHRDEPGYDPDERIIHDAEVIYIL